MHTGRILIQFCMWLCARVRYNNDEVDSVVSAGGCADADTFSCEIMKATEEVVHGDGVKFWCAECEGDLCNSTAGLSVGALSMVILGTVMQVLA